MTTWLLEKAVNRRPRIMASAMSVTWNSSKHRGRCAWRSAPATCGIGSPSTDLRASPMRSCTSAMNSWKWMRRFGWKSRGLEEEVHQHGLAAADLAVDVEAGRRLSARSRAEQAAERPGARGAPSLQFSGKAVETVGNGLLSGVRVHLARGQAALEALADHCALSHGARLQGGHATVKPFAAGRGAGKLAASPRYCRGICAAAPKSERFGMLKF